jgi:hypothetical protein
VGHPGLENIDKFPLKGTSPPSSCRETSPNCSNNKEVRICPAAQTLLSVQPISQVLEVQMISNVYPGKMRQFPRTFMIYVCSDYDVTNDVFGRQEDKNCHQVKMWPPTHQLVNKSIVPNFGL